MHMAREARRGALKSLPVELNWFSPRLGLPSKEKIQSVLERALGNDKEPSGMLFRLEVQELLITSTGDRLLRACPCCAIQRLTLRKEG